MSKKDKIILDHSGREHDGNSFVVTTLLGTNLKFRDADQLEAVVARWQQALKTVIGTPTPAYLDFSGARSSIEDEDGKQEVGKLEGRGTILANQIIAIRYETDADDHTEQAMNAARAFFEVQAEAAAEALSGAGEGEEDYEGDEGEGDEVGAGTLTVTPVVSDDDLEGFKPPAAAA